MNRRTAPLLFAMTLLLPCCATRPPDPWRPNNLSADMDDQVETYIADASAKRRGEALLRVINARGPGQVLEARCYTEPIDYAFDPPDPRPAVVFARLTLERHGIKAWEQAMPPTDRPASIPGPPVYLPWWFPPGTKVSAYYDPSELFGGTGFAALSEDKQFLYLYTTISSNP